MAKITYANKVKLNNKPSIANINKIRDVDINEIKTVVNANDDLMGNLSNLQTTYKANLVGAINENKGSLTQINNKYNLTSIKACNGVTGNFFISDAAAVPFRTQYFNNSNGKIVFQDNGLVTINHTGHVKISTQLWLNADSQTGVQVWMRLNEYVEPQNRLGNAINVIPNQNYLTMGIYDLIIETVSGMQILLIVGHNGSRQIIANAGSGGVGSSYMTIEIID